MRGYILDQVDIDITSDLDTEQFFEIMICGIKDNYFSSDPEKVMYTHSYIYSKDPSCRRGRVRKLP